MPALYTVHSEHISNDPIDFATMLGYCYHKLDFKLTIAHEINVL